MNKAQMLEQRCFLLFVSLLVLFVAMAFFTGTAPGRAFVGLLNATVLVMAVAAVGRSKLSWVVAIALAVPTLAFQVLALISGKPEHFAMSWSFGAVFYAFTIADLLHYVLRRDVMTADKLYGAVAAYVMIAIMWAFVHGVLDYFYTGAYQYHGTQKTLDMGELLFYSFTVLTTAGFGDITPAIIQSRLLTILEAVTGVMYIAILIARLTGVYPIAVRPAAASRQPE